MADKPLYAAKSEGMSPEKGATGRVAGSRTRQWSHTTRTKRSVGLIDMTTPSPGTVLSDQCEPVSEFDHQPQLRQRAGAIRPERRSGFV